MAQPDAFHYFFVILTSLECRTRFLKFFHAGRQASISGAMSTSMNQSLNQGTS